LWFFVVYNEYGFACHDFFGVRRPGAALLLPIKTAVARL
jgi:hypothetical protein